MSQNRTVCVQTLSAPAVGTLRKYCGSNITECYYPKQQNLFLRLTMYNTEIPVGIKILCQNPVLGIFRSRRSRLLYILSPLCKINYEYMHHVNIRLASNYFGRSAVLSPLSCCGSVVFEQIA